LSAVIRSHLRMTVSGTGGSGIGCEAEAGQPALAILAESAGNIERQIYPVANLDTFNSGPNLNDLTEILVPEDLSLFNGGAALCMCGSEPQMFVIVIFTSASVGFSIFGSGTLCIRTTSGPS
jgi:hypothetical protein